MNITRNLFALVLIGAPIASAAVACGGDDEGAGGGGASDATGSGAGPTCYSVETNDSGDGTEACGPVTCSGGEYCFDTTGICDPGCLDALDCSSGDYCNLDNANGGVGVCMTPGPDLEKPCSGSGGSCNDRCGAKASSCGAPSGFATQACSELCAMASEDQISCIESSSCQDLGEAFEQGQPLCGLTPPSD